MQVILLWLKIQTRFTDWQRALDSKDLMVKINQTETVVCANTNERLMIRDRLD